MATGARHRAPSATRSGTGWKRAVAAIGVFAAVAGLGAYVINRATSASSLSAPSSQSTSGACPRAVVRVAADPSIARVISDATADLGPWTEAGQCVQISVSARSSATVAAEIARSSGVGFDAPLPDVWVPDSSMWLAMAKKSAIGEARLRQEPVSIATSPVVVALSPSAATRLGWPQTQPGWSAMVASAPATLRLGTADPRVNTAGLTALLATSGDAPTAASLAAVGRRVTVPALGRRTPAEVVADGGVDAMPATELDVITANQTPSRKAKVVAAYDPAVGPPLDYPLVLVTSDKGVVDKPISDAFDVLRKALTSDETQQLVSAAGLRTSRGELGSVFGTESGVQAAQLNAAKPATSAAVTAAESAWSTVGRRSRLLVLVDRSGSMGSALPGGRTSKSQVAQQSLSKLIDSAAPDSDIGLWSFTTTGGAGGITTLVDTGPMSAATGTSPGTRREKLRAALGQLAPVRGGGTPLYRAVQAAYASAQRDYAYGRLNAVIVVTDGRDEDTASGRPSRSQLLSTLRQQFDGMRPVRIVTLAYGADADVGVLREMADATGGLSFTGLTEADAASLLATTLARL